MKKISAILVVLLLSGVAAFGQKKVYDKFGTTFKKDGYDLTTEQRILELSDINGVDLNPEWTKYCRQRNAGLGLIISGGALTAVSGSLFVAYTEGYTIRKELFLEDSPVLAEYKVRSLGTGAATLAGAAILGAGLGLYLSANRHLESIISTANMSLGLHASANGVGLALKF